ncbi:ABC transporter permease [Micromonospora sp. AMSO31t]|nr:ABC transporter permease [Micromonospora sp. AMSO31t]
MPALDQTRAVSLVALPGASVGVLLGGGSPFRPEQPNFWSWWRC